MTGIGEKALAQPVKPPLRERCACLAKLVKNRLTLTAFGTLPELNAFLAEGCAGVNAAARCRDGRPHGEAYREDLAAMRALPGVEFDAVRWVAARADKRGYVEADGREYVAGPAWHGRSLLVGMRASTVEILADRGRLLASI